MDAEEAEVAEKDLKMEMATVRDPKDINSELQI